MRQLLVLILLLAFCGNALSASNDLELISEHTFSDMSTELILYVTLRNTGMKPLTVLTMMPNVGAAIRGGAWAFDFQASFYGGDYSPMPPPSDISLLLPVKLDPGKQT